MSAAVLSGLAEALLFMAAIGLLWSGFMLIREQQERRSRLRRTRGR